MFVYAPVVISILALAASLLSLWKAYLAPFELKISYDSPRFALYKITPKISGGAGVWWIPSISIGFTVHNAGRKVGELTDIRIIGTLENDSGKKTYPFYAKWVVDYARYNADKSNRMKWLRDAVLRDWYPILLSGNEQQSFHLVLEEGRWDEKLTGTLRLSLEVYSSSANDWQQLDKYSHFLNTKMYDERSSYILSDARLERIRDVHGNWHDDIKISS